MENLSLMAIMALVLGVALIGGMIARRLRLPVIIGYLLSGIVIGPNVLGIVHDVEDVETLATIGVVLLMFALGLEFSLKSLRQIGMIAILGGIAQIIITIGLGVVIGLAFDHSLLESIIFGLLIAFSSTIIVLKTLMDRGELGSTHGQVMIGILLVQDLCVVPIMAILPSLNETGSVLAQNVGWDLLRAAIFLGGTFVLGFWGLPLFMRRVAGERSRELFLLTIVCICLGAAFTAYSFGLSIALGAFLAGLLISESEYAHQALADIRPLRDVFAVLFFVSLGMLADPGYAAENPLKVAAIVAAIVFGKSFIISIIPLVFGYGAKTSLFVAGGLYQIGEFSFILAALALEEQIISADLYSLTLTVAVITILMTPFSMNLTSKFYYRIIKTDRFSRLFTEGINPEAAGEDLSPTGHVVICGYGKTASNLALVLDNRGFDYIIIDIDHRAIASARKKGVPCIYGDPSNPEILARANLQKARVLVITFRDPIATRLVVENARRINRRLDIVARVRGDEYTEELRALGVSQLVRPEVEVGLEIIRHTMHRFGLSPQETQFIISRLREENS